MGDRRMNNHRVIYATSYWQRFMGLMFKKDFNKLMVFEFKKPQWIIIHTWFMRFSIDIFCYNDKNELIREINCVRPWKIILVKNVKYFVERKTYKLLDLNNGDD
jgi:uncharacterized membrane protein (UPF0127 family)